MEDFKTAWRNADPKIRAELTYRWGVHEAGHAVARWALDQMGYLGRYATLPCLKHVAINLDGGGVEGSREMRSDLNGVCAADPCFFWPTNAPLPKNYPIPPSVVRRLACADIIHTMAGPIAEMLHDGVPYENACGWRWGEIDRASDAAEGERGTDSWHVECKIALLGRRWRLHLERAFQLADRIVRDHQPHIRTLAAALVERGVIGGEEVEAIFDAIGLPP
jgi:hypothetical protein